VQESDVEPAPAEPVSPEPKAAKPEAKHSEKPEAPPSAAEPEAPAVGPARPPRTKDLLFLADEDGYFPSNGPLVEPRVVLGVHKPKAKEKALATDLYDRGAFVDLDEDGRRRFGIAPLDSVWMFGTDGPCRAKVRGSYAQAYIETESALEIGHRIEACTKNAAPVVFVGETPPALRWVEATEEFSKPIDPKTWSHPARPLLERWGLIPKKRKPPATHIRIERAANAHNLAFAHHWPPDVVEFEEENVVGACALQTPSGFVELPHDSVMSPGLLAGALVDNGQAQVVFLSYEYQLRVWTAAEPGRWTEFTTGIYHEEEIVYFGWSVLEDGGEP
jgi:hypothetical protein